MLSGHILFTIFYIFAGLILLIFAYGLFTLPRRKKGQDMTVLLKGTPGDAGVCPICGTLFRNGEQVKSALFPGTSDRICHIFGCPHCYPYAEHDITRECPVCKKKLPQEGYLVARYFERQNGKKHVHILGCTECRLTGKKNTPR